MVSEYTERIYKAVNKDNLDCDEIKEIIHDTLDEMLDECYEAIYTEVTKSFSRSYSEFKDNILQSIDNLSVW